LLLDRLRARRSRARSYGRIQSCLCGM